MEQQARPQNPRFVASTISLGTFSTISIVLGLAGTVVLARHYSAAVFGVYTLVLVIVNFLGQFSTLGLEMGISKFIAGSEGQAEREHLLSTAAIVRVAAILLACVLAWIGRSPLVKLFGGSLLSDIFIYVPLLFALDSSRAFLRSILQGSLLFPRIGITDVIASSLNFMLLLVIIYFFNNNTVAGLILIRALSTFVACVFAFVSIPIKKRLSFHVDDFKKLVKFGFPLQINDILQFTQSRIDTLVVAALLGPVDIALYEVARKIPDHLRSLYEPFRSVYYPFLTKRYQLGDQEKASSLVNDSVRFVAFIMLFGTAISLLFSKDIILLLFSEKYVASAPVFVILMINLSIALVSNVMGTTLVAAGDSDKPLIINTLNAVISLLGSLLLIPGFRIIGAALANITGTAIAYPLNAFFLRRRIGFRNAAYLKPVALFCAWNMLVWVIKPDSIYIKVGFLATFLVASFLLSIVTKEDVLLLVQGSGIADWKPVQKVRIWAGKL